MADLFGKLTRNIERAAPDFSRLGNRHGVGAAVKALTTGVVKEVGAVLGQVVEAPKTHVKPSTNALAKAKPLQQPRRAQASYSPGGTGM